MDQSRLEREFFKAYKTLQRNKAKELELKIKELVKLKQDTLKEINENSNKYTEEDIELYNLQCENAQLLKELAYERLNKLKAEILEYQD